MARGWGELTAVARGQALNNGATFRFNREFPLGEAWRVLLLHFHETVVIGTGTGARSEGELEYISGIRLTTGRGDVIVDSVPGRALYRYAQLLDETESDRDAVAAASATYDVLLPIYFVDPLAARPEDTLLDTQRFSDTGLSLEITVGGVAQLFTSVGTSTVATTVDVYVDRSRGRLDPAVSPAFAPYYRHFGPVVPGTVNEILIERAVNLAYKRFGLFTSSVNTVAGTPFSGTALDTILSLIDIEAEHGKLLHEGIPNFLQERNVNEYRLAANMAGWYWFDLVKDRSIQSAFSSGQTSRLREYFTFNAGATPQASLFTAGLRPLL